MGETRSDVKSKPYEHGTGKSDMAGVLNAREQHSLEVTWAVAGVVVVGEIALSKVKLDVSFSCVTWKNYPSRSIIEMCVLISWNVVCLCGVGSRSNPFPPIIGIVI